VQLSLDVDIDKFKYNGVVDITIEPQKKVNEVTLHSNGPKIGKVEVSYNQFGSFRQPWGEVLSITEDEELMTLTFHLSKALEAGHTYQLKIEFDGEIRTKLSGFYRSSYHTGNETR